MFMLLANTLFFVVILGSFTKTISFTSAEVMTILTAPPEYWVSLINSWSWCSKSSSISKYYPCFFSHNFLIHAAPVLDLPAGDHSSLWYCLANIHAWYFPLSYQTCQFLWNVAVMLLHHSLKHIWLSFLLCFPVKKIVTSPFHS